jgi:hypothetical protein
MYNLYNTHARTSTCTFVAIVRTSLSARATSHKIIPEMIHRFGFAISSSSSNFFSCFISSLYVAHYLWTKNMIPRFFSQEVKNCRKKKKSSFVRLEFILRFVEKILETVLYYQIRITIRRKLQIVNSPCWALAFCLSSRKTITNNDYRSRQKPQCAVCHRKTAPQDTNIVVPLDTWTPSSSFRQ